VNGPTALLVVSVTVPAVGFLAAAAIRLVLGRRHRWQLGWAASTLCGIVGAALGAGVTALAIDRSARQAPVAVVLGGLVGTALVLGAAEGRRTTSARSTAGPDGSVSTADPGPAPPSAPQPVRLAPNAPTDAAL
jgi:uncharacterized membrane protein YeaQ/YmgE (transglycosylase-associated protein family)